jgi:hypothetical protein
VVRDGVSRRPGPVPPFVPRLPIRTAGAIEGISRGHARPRHWRQPADDGGGGDKDDLLERTGLVDTPKREGFSRRPMTMRQFARKRQRVH